MILKKYHITITVRPLAEVVDPEGDAIQEGLRDLGYPTVSKVRVGKLVELQIEAENEDEAKARATAMSERLLANPIIEQFEILVDEARKTSV